jgi:hypothetical protein
LHLAIVEYIATKAKDNVGNISAKGEATNADKDTAIKNAQKIAIADIKGQVKDYTKKWRDISDKVTELYDKDTDHSKNAKAQKDWQENYKMKIDKVLKDEGWKK